MGQRVASLNYRGGGGGEMPKCYISCRYLQRCIKIDRRSFKVLKDPFSTLENESTYAYYRKMFNIKTSEVYYIYSTSTALPSGSDFTDKNRVYFHKLKLLPPLYA